MKKIFTLVLSVMLILALTGCGSPKSDQQVDSGSIINPIDLTFSLLDADEDDVTADDFTPIKDEAFIAEEGSSVLDATQLFCISHDLSVTVDRDKGYVTEINGLTAGDYSEHTGWIFFVNGEIGTVSAEEQILKDGDSITWKFVDSDTYPWQ